MKTKFITLITLFLCISAFAQRPSKEKLKAFKIAHITEQLDLTVKEAQAFWPIYNENEESREKLREQSIKRRKEKQPTELSEPEAKTILLEMLTIENKKHELNNNYLNKLLKVLPAKKIINLMQAERSFKKKLIEEFKDRHRGEKPNRKRN